MLLGIKKTLLKQPICCTDDFHFCGDLIFRHVGHHSAAPEHSEFRWCVPIGPLGHFVISTFESAELIATLETVQQQISHRPQCSSVPAAVSNASIGHFSSDRRRTQRFDPDGKIVVNFPSFPAAGRIISSLQGKLRTGHGYFT